MAADATARVKGATIDIGPPHQQAERAKPETALQLEGALVHSSESKASMASMSESLRNAWNAIKGIFDPQGNEFSLEVGSRSIESQLQQYRGQEIKPDKGTSASTSPDGTSMYVQKRNGSLTSISFAPDGKLQSETTIDRSGYSTTTQYDAQGNATRRQISSPEGGTFDVPVPPGTSAQTFAIGGGNTAIQFSENGKLHGVAFDQGHHITQTWTIDGNNKAWTNFDPATGQPTDRTVEVRDGDKTITTTTQPGYKSIRTTHANGGDVQETIIDQHGPVLGRIDPEYTQVQQRIEHPDGSQDVTTKFNNDPGYTYNTHVDPQGAFETYKDNDQTHERHLWERGRLSRRI
jgi:hypothetical protein